MYITIQDYCAAAGVSEATVSRRLKGVPYITPPRESGRRYYHLATAVQTLRAKELESGAAKLAGSAHDLSCGLHVEAEALTTAQGFSDWLPTEAMRNRLRAAQNSFVVSVGNSRLCTPTIVRNLPPLRELLALCPPILAWVLKGGTPPDVDTLAPAFAVSCNCAALDHHTNLQEAC